MNIRKLVLAIIALCSVTVASAQSELYVGRTIHLVTPAGQCLLGSTPLEVEVCPSVDQSMAGYNYGLAVVEDAERGQLNAQLHALSEALPMRLNPGYSSTTEAALLQRERGF